MKRVKSKKRINPKKLAKALGAKHITDPKEKSEFEKRHGFPHPLIPMPKSKK